MQDVLVNAIFIALSVAILGGVWLAHRSYERPPEESGEDAPAGSRLKPPIGL
jgi:hypothetical protein